MFPVLFPQVDALSKAVQSDLRLTAEEARRLISAQEHALRDAGRIEIAPGGLESILRAFADSPFLSSADRCETLCELIELFYALKAETQDRISDEALLIRMREAFDGCCHGSALRLSDVLGGGFQWRL